MGSLNPEVALIGDGIENPWNARALLDVAAMFSGSCLFRDRARLATSWEDLSAGHSRLSLITPDQVASGFDPVIALDNLEDARDIYGFRLPEGRAPAVVVGNERRGIARDMQAVASHSVQIPMQSIQLNTLNVAAAAGIALYYLSHGGAPKMHVSAYPRERRPEILLLAPIDHVEVGSAIRSASAFGWDRVSLDDRAGVWSGVDRIRRSEGRAAARRARNAIHLVPSRFNQRFAFDEVCVITTGESGDSLRRAKLARGRRQLLVIPDERGVSVEDEDWSRLGKNVTLLWLELPASALRERFRVGASITLSEAARQAGRPSGRITAPKRRGKPAYEHAFNLVTSGSGELIDREDLEAY